MQKAIPFGLFTMTYDTGTGETYTIFNDGKISGCGVVPEDYYHAELLGITAKEHRFEHELVHHLIGIYYYKEPYSPVIYHDAYVSRDRDSFPEQAKEEEWLVTAVQYYLHNAEWPYRDTGIAAIKFSIGSIDALMEDVKKYLDLIKQPC